MIFDLATPWDMSLYISFDIMYDFHFTLMAFVFGLWFDFCTTPPPPFFFLSMVPLQCVTLFNSHL